MPKYTCEYCDNTFKTKQILTRHQRRVAYCLQIQGKENQLYRCTCGRVYTLKTSLQRHQALCTKEVDTPDLSPTEPKKDNQEELLRMVIDKYGDMVKDLQKQITDLAANRPVSNVANVANNRNMVMQNLQPITDEALQEHLNHLTLNFIQNGAKGYADFAGNYPFKDKVLCTDRSRRKIKYKDGDGELTDDGRILAQRFFQAISERNTEILNQAYSDLHHEMQSIVAGGRAGDADVTGILTKATTLQDILIKSQNAARGEDDEFAQEFLSHLTKML